MKPTTASDTPKRPVIPMETCRSAYFDKIEVVQVTPGKNRATGLIKLVQKGWKKIEQYASSLYRRVVLTTEERSVAEFRERVKSFDTAVVELLDSFGDEIDCDEHWLKMVGAQAKINTFRPAMTFSEKCNNAHGFTLRTGSRQEMLLESFSLQFTSDTTAVPSKDRSGNEKTDAVHPALWKMQSLLSLITAPKAFQLAGLHDSNGGETAGPTMGNEETGEFAGRANLVCALMSKTIDGFEKTYESIKYDLRPKDLEVLSICIDYLACFDKKENALTPGDNMSHEHVPSAKPLIENLRKRMKELELTRTLSMECASATPDRNKIKAKMLEIAKLIPPARGIASAQHPKSAVMQNENHDPDILKLERAIQLELQTMSAKACLTMLDICRSENLYPSTSTGNDAPKELVVLDSHQKAVVSSFSQACSIRLFGPDKTQKDLTNDELQGYISDSQTRAPNLCKAFTTDLRLRHWDQFKSSLDVFLKSCNPETMLLTTQTKLSEITEIHSNLIGLDAKSKVIGNQIENSVREHMAKLNTGEKLQLLSRLSSLVRQESNMSPAMQFLANVFFEMVRKHSGWDEEIRINDARPLDEEVLKVELSRVKFNDLILIFSSLAQNPVTGLNTLMNIIEATCFRRLQDNRDKILTTVKT